MDAVGGWGWRGVAPAVTRAHWRDLGGCRHTDIHIMMLLYQENTGLSLCFPELKSSLKKRTNPGC